MDDYFEDDAYDPDTDHMEDQAEEAGIFDEGESLIDEPISDVPADDKFDLTDAMIIGTMIGGQMFDEAEERRRRKLIEEQEKDK